jgi:leader peptidase (prepilin peptidase)/N-methyltransferase
MELFAIPLLLPLAGLCVGSWLGVVIRRRDWLFRRSACESCGVALGMAELVPVLSFLVQCGRCRHCDARIGWFAPAVELAALAAAVAALAADGPGPAAWVDAGLGWALLAAGWIDAETFILPDAITLPLVLAGLAVTWWQDPAALSDHAAAAALGYVGFRALNAGYRAWRGRDGLGAGDAKLLAAAGAWLGVLALPYVILLAGLLGLGLAGLLWLRGQALAGSQKIPFGPALAMGFFVLRLTGWGQ